MKENKVKLYVGLVFGAVAVVTFYSGIITICIALAVWGFKLSPLFGGMALVVDSLILYYLYSTSQ